MEFVHIRHPKVAEPYRCPISALPHWESYGWVRFDPEPPKPPGVIETPETVESIGDSRRTPRASRRAAATEE